MKIIRVAVNGKSKSELCQRLKEIADEIEKENNDNVIGIHNGFDFDFQIDDMDDEEMVTVGFPDPPPWG